MKKNSPPLIFQKKKGRSGWVLKEKKHVFVLTYVLHFQARILDFSIYLNCILFFTSPVYGLHIQQSSRSSHHFKVSYSINQYIFPSWEVGLLSIIYNSLILYIMMYLLLNKFECNYKIMGKKLSCSLPLYLQQSIGILTVAKWQRKHKFW